MSPSNIALLRQAPFPSDPRVRKEVAALLAAGHSVDVLCQRVAGETPIEQWRGATVHRLDIARRRGSGFRGQLGEYGEFLTKVAGRLAWLHRRKEFALVQVNTLPDFLSFAATSARLTGAGVLLDMHELMPEFFASSYSGVGFKTLLRTAKAGEWLAARAADHVLFVSPLQASIIGRRIGRPFTVVPNTPDEDVFRPLGGSIPRQQRPVVMTHGTVAERYGAQLLIEALPAVLREMDVEVWVVGDGEYLPELRALADRVGVTANLRFTGWVELESVPGLIHRASLGVVPLLPGGYGELMSPNKLFEYIAMERPTLCADLPGIRAYLTEKQTEFFSPGDSADLAQKMLLLLRDQQRWAEIVQEASIVYQRLRWKVAAQHYLTAVEGLLAASEDRRRAA